MKKIYILLKIFYLSIKFVNIISKLKKSRKIIWGKLEKLPYQNNFLTLLTNNVELWSQTFQILT